MKPKVTKENYEYFLDSDDIELRTLAEAFEDEELDEDEY